MTLGEWLSQTRRRLQMTQQEVSRESGVAQTTISALETKTAAITRKAQELIRVAEALDVSALEAYQQAGLFAFSREEDRDAIEAALLIRQMDSGERHELLERLRKK